MLYTVHPATYAINFVGPCLLAPDKLICQTDLRTDILNISIEIALKKKP